jgi:PAS domain S-box-containing protein
MQTFSQNTVAVEVTDLAASNKKSVIRVLHVDDDVGFLEVSKLILATENNFEVDYATSVDEALRKIETHPYDAVVCDFEMPLKNGLDFLKELREKNNQIPFILFLGRGREDIAVAALNLGADSYLNKTGSPEAVFCELAHAINNTVEQKRSAQLLVASESKYRMLVEKSLQGIMIVQDAPLRVIFVNESMGKMMGYSCEELTSIPSSEVGTLIYQADRSIFFDRFRNLLGGKKADKTFEFRGMRKDGSIVWIEALATPIKYNGQPAMQAMLLDITERKKAEEVLRKSEEKHRELANFLPEIVFETDLSGKITFFNQRVLEITGFTQEEFENGMNLLSFVVPEEREKAKVYMEKSIAGQNCGANEYTFLRKNGSTFVAFFRTALLISETKVRGLRGIIVDITERKQMENKLEQYSKHLEELIETRTKELKETQQLLVESERFAAIGELAGMIGHDLRNPLASIKNAVYFLKKKGTTIPEVSFKEMLEIIGKCIDHSDKIINNLMSYSRELHLEREESSPRNLVLAALDLIKVPENVQILNNVPEEPHIKVDSNRITQVFFNLIKNGIDAIPKEGSLTIDCKNIGGNLEISFTDTGMGIPGEILPKIFSPLVTTKAQGMGFGLAICKRIIDAHEGTITVITDEHKGTTFTVKLPIKPVFETKRELELSHRVLMEKSLKCVGLFNCQNPEKCSNYEQCLKKYLHAEAGDEISKFYF